MYTSIEGAGGACSTTLCKGSKGLICWMDCFVVVVVVVVDDVVVLEGAMVAQKGADYRA